MAEAIETAIGNLKQKPTDLSISAKAAKIPNKVYTKKAIKPAVKVTSGSKTLKKGTDYTVSYKNNIKIGKAAVIIKGTGAYTGTLKTEFLILPAKGRITGLKPGKKQITVTYKTQKSQTGKTGYRIVYSPAKGHAKAVKTTAGKKTIKGLQSKKSYKVKVRVYKTIEGKIYNGTYSTVKKVKVK